MNAIAIGELPKLCVKIRPDSWFVCGPFRCHRRWQRNGPQINQLSGRIFTHNLSNSPMETVERAYERAGERTFKRTFTLWNFHSHIVNPTVF